ncbi:MAG: DHH family phosphoesterase [Acidimicrobiales bacterium]
MSSSPEPDATVASAAHSLVDDLVGGLHQDALERAAATIDDASSVALACYVHPDGDALGSLMGMRLLCEAHGTPAICSWPDPFVVGPHYEYLPGLDLAVPPAEFPSRPEVMATFDLGSVARLGSLAPSAQHARQSGELIVIDHHEDNQRFGTINLVDTRAAATAVVVRDLAATLDWKLTRDVAVCLYTGLVTDTGRFRYPNTTPEVFHLAEELASFDIDIARIEWQLFEKHRFTYLRLIASVLERARLEPETGFVATWCTLADLDEHGVEFDETEGLIDVIRQTAEAGVSCVIREAPDEGNRVSLRSTGSIDVGALARQFGGGGHWFMAGFVSPDPVATLLDRIEAAVRDVAPP